VKNSLERTKQILNETKILILDTSVLLCYFIDEIQDINALLEQYIFKPDSKITLYGHNLIKAELFYITCRLKGINEAVDLLNNLEKIMNSINDSWIYKKAANIKCKFPIAISDCFSIALANLLDCPVFFLPEQELQAKLIENINNTFNTEIHLIGI